MVFPQSGVLRGESTSFSSSVFPLQALGFDLPPIYEVIFIYCILFSSTVYWVLQCDFQAEKGASNGTMPLTSVLILLKTRNFYLLYLVNKTVLWTTLPFGNNWA